MGDEKRNQQVDVTEVTNPFRFGKVDSRGTGPTACGFLLSF
jgi:hypothetical protein